MKEVTKYEEATVDETDSESDSSDWDLYMIDVDVFEEPHKSVNGNAIAEPATFKTSLKFLERSRFLFTLIVEVQLM